MNIENFSCISSRVENTGQLYGCFKIGPFFESQSLTFANSLRRTLLAHSSKCIFNAVQIYGVEHEFSSLLGVRESIVDILLNLEKLAFQTIKPLTKPQIGFVNFCGPGILQGKHIHLPSNFKCINPSQYIATLEVDGELIFKLFFPPSEFVSNFRENRIKKRSNSIQTDSYLNMFSQKFLEIQTDSCLNMFSQKFLEIQTKFILNRSQKEKLFPEKNQENFLFLKNSLNVIEKVNYTLQPSNFEIKHDDLSLIDKINQFGNVVKPLKLNLKLLKKKNKQSTTPIPTTPIPTTPIPTTPIPTLISSEFIILEIWTNGSIHPQTAILKAMNELLLKFFPYSLKISKIENQNFPRFKQIKRRYITNLSKSCFRENFMNLDISNFYFDLETLIFLKNNQIHRIIDFLIFLQKIKNNKNNLNSHFYNINKLSIDSKIKTTLLKFNKFISRFIEI